MEMLEILLQSSSPVTTTTVAVGSRCIVMRLHNLVEGIGVESAGDQRQAPQGDCDGDNKGTADNRVEHVQGNYKLVHTCVLVKLYVAKGSSTLQHYKFAVCNCMNQMMHCHV